eukprot:scaffold139121_cov39-Prasinocladus_malaysianus.AAC.1
MAAHALVRVLLRSTSYVFRNGTRTSTSSKLAGRLKAPSLHWNAGMDRSDYISRYNAVRGEAQYIKKKCAVNDIVALIPDTCPKNYMDNPIAQNPECHAYFRILTWNTAYQ